MRNFSKIAILVTAAALLLSSVEVNAQGKTPTIPTPKIPTVPIPWANPHLLGVQDPRYADLQSRMNKERTPTVEERIAELLEEFGINARYGVTNNFIYIYDTTNYYALWVAVHCERVERVFGQFAKFLKFPEKELEEPMIVIIFTNKSDFVDYATKNFPGYASMKNKPIGFYSSGSNRAVFFDFTQTDREKGEEDMNQKRTLAEVATEILSHPDGKNALSVVIHEITHQVSYNRGLFNRYGKNPDWAVEGLACLFEPPIGPIEEGGWKVESDFAANMRRVREFQQYVANRTDGPKFLYRIVSAEDISTDVNGAYATSWALMAYLYKKFPKRLAAYLNYTASIDRQSYTMLERVNEFETFFTNDWNQLYQELCAFVTAVQNNPEGFTWVPTQEELKKVKAEERKAKEKEEEEKAAAEKAEAEKAAAEEAKKDGDDLFELEDGVELKDESGDEELSGEGDGEEKPKSEEENKTEPKKGMFELEDDEEESENKPETNTTPDEPKTESGPKSEPKKTNEPADDAKKGKSAAIVVEGLTVDGKPLDWNNYKDKVVIVNFWATWNNQSVEEQKLLTELYDKYHAKGLEIVGYSLDDDAATLKSFLDKNKYGWTILSQQLSRSNKQYPDMSEKLRVFSLPSSVIVGKDGSKIGTTLRGEKLRAKIEEIME